MMCSRGAGDDAGPGAAAAITADSSTRRCSNIGRLSASDARRPLRGSPRAVVAVAAVVAVVGVIMSISSAPPSLGSNADMIEEVVN